MDVAAGFAFQVPFQMTLGTDLGTVPGVTPRANLAATPTSTGWDSYHPFCTMTRVSLIGLTRTM